MSTHPLDMPLAGKDVNQLARNLAIYYGARDIQQNAVAIRPGSADAFGLVWHRWYDIRPMLDGALHSAGDIALRQATLQLLACCKRIERHADHPHYVRFLTAEPLAEALRDATEPASPSTVQFAAARATTTAETQHAAC